MLEDKQAIAQRKAIFLRAANEVAQRWYSCDGDWIASTTPHLTRERFWMCFAFYANGSDRLADAIIRGSKVAKTPHEFSIFDPNIACALLVNHRERMAIDVREKLEVLVRTAFGFKPGNRQPDFQFHGFNDNMPAKATMGLILGGELLGESGAVQYGLWNLRQLRAMLVRRGINSEWNSPTYLPLTLHAMAEIVSHAQCNEARELAHGVETRLWLDLAGRFHHATGVLAGPYARAYTVDTIAHLSNAASLLWFHLGDHSCVTPMSLLERTTELVLHHMGDVPFNIAQTSWLAVPEYHVPLAAWRLFEKRQYPCRAVATFEVGDSGTDWPARQGRIETFQQIDYAVGTASTVYGGGEQCLPYAATYRRRENVESVFDVGTVYSKIVVNDQIPGTVRTSDGQEIDASTPDTTFRGEVDLLTSRANTITLQDDSTALILTHPHLDLGGSIDDYVPSLSQTALPFSALSELVICSAHSASTCDNGAKEIFVGGEPRENWEGEVPSGTWIVCRRGQMLLGLRPLVFRCDSESVPVTLEKINNYEVLRATWYRGEERFFSRSELRYLFGGFVAEHASIDEFASTAEFASMLQNTQFTDYFWITRRTRYRRPENQQRAALDMEVSWSTGSTTPRYATVNGHPVDMPVVSIDGVTREEIPFWDKPFSAVPGFFPWEDFSNVWYELPYGIGDREAENAAFGMLA